MSVRNRRRFEVIFVVSAVTVSVIAGCGGGSSHTSSITTASITQSAQGDQLGGVRVACEQYGASALLPGSNGQDTSSVPDNTTAVCDCWTQWMHENLSPAEQATVSTSVEQSESVLPITDVATDLSLVSHLTTALQSCDLGQAPTTNANSSPEPSTSTGTIANGTSVRCGTFTIAGTTMTVVANSSAVPCSNALSIAQQFRSDLQQLPFLISIGDLLGSPPWEWDCVTRGDANSFTCTDQRGDGPDRFDVHPAG